jgi:hypothetical protein
MASESTLRKRLRDAMKPWAQVVPIETGATVQGVPDTLLVFSVYDQAEPVYVWAELKEADAPKRESTVPFRGAVRPDQVQWHRWYGGLGCRTFFLLQLGTGLYLMPGTAAHEINTALNTLHIQHAARWQVSRAASQVDWKRFADIVCSGHEVRPAPRHVVVSPAL